MKTKGWLIIMVVFAGCLILYRYSPAESSFYLPCIFKKITGLNCPGCGSTRAIHYLLHGKWMTAVSYNLLLIILLPVIVAGLVTYATGKPNKVWKFANRPLWILALIISFTLLRNLEHTAFSWLHSDK